MALREVPKRPGERSPREGEDDVTRAPADATRAPAGGPAGDTRAPDAEAGPGAPRREAELPLDDLADMGRRSSETESDGFPEPRDWGGPTRGERRRPRLGCLVAGALLAVTAALGAYLVLHKPSVRVPPQPPAAVAEVEPDKRAEAKPGEKAGAQPAVPVKEQAALPPAARKLASTNEYINYGIDFSKLGYYGAHVIFKDIKDASQECGGLKEVSMVSMGREQTRWKAIMEDELSAVKNAANNQWRGDPQKPLRFFTLEDYKRMWDAAGGAEDGARGVILGAMLLKNKVVVQDFRSQQAAGFPNGRYVVPDEKGAAFILFTMQQIPLPDGVKVMSAREAQMTPEDYKKHEEDFSKTHGKKQKFKYTVGERTSQTEGWRNVKKGVIHLSPDIAIEDLEVKKLNEEYGPPVSHGGKLMWIVDRDKNEAIPLKPDGSIGPPMTGVKLLPKAAKPPAKAPAEVKPGAPEVKPDAPEVKPGAPEVKPGAPEAKTLEQKAQDEIQRMRKILEKGGNTKAIERLDKRVSDLTEKHGPPKLETSIGKLRPVWTETAKDGKPKKHTLMENGGVTTITEKPAEKPPEVKPAEKPPDPLSWIQPNQLLQIIDSETKKVLVTFTPPLTGGGDADLSQPITLDDGLIYKMSKDPKTGELVIQPAEPTTAKTDANGKATVEIPTTKVELSPAPAENPAK